VANKALFDQHRDQVPVDLILFVCDGHIAAGGDENFDRAEDILRNWLVKNSEDTGIDDSTKAKVQLMLAKNYYKAQRFDVARKPNRHVAFGHGDHACAGMNVARMEARIAFGRLLARLSKIEPGGAPERDRRIRFRGFRKLPVRVAV